MTKIMHCAMSNLAFNVIGLGINTGPSVRPRVLVLSCTRQALFSSCYTEVVRMRIPH